MNVQQEINYLIELVWLAITKASHAASVIPTPWIDVPAGATVAVPAQNADLYYAIDASAAQVTMDLPATPVVGQTVIFKIKGAAAAAVKLTAGAGTSIEDPTTPGTQSAVAGTVGMSVQGLLWGVKFDHNTSSWIQVQ